MHKVLSRCTTRQIITRSISSTRISSTSLSERLKQRRPPSTTSSADLPPETTTRYNRNRSAIVSTPATTVPVPNLPASNQPHNLTTALDSIATRATETDPEEAIREREIQAKRQKENDRIKWERRDKSKVVIEEKKRQARVQSQANGTSDGVTGQKSDSVEGSTSSRGIDRTGQSDVRRRMGFSNRGKDKRDLKKALRLARLSTGGSLTEGEQSKLKQLQGDLSALKRKRKRMVPWDHLSTKLRKMETYKIERRIKRDEEREALKEEKIKASNSTSDDSTTTPSAPSTSISADASFDEMLSKATPVSISALSSPSNNNPSSRSTSDNHVDSSTTPETSEQVSKRKYEAMKRQLHVETARRAWSMRRSTIDQEIADLERAISNYLPPSTTTPKDGLSSTMTEPQRGPPIPVPRKRTSPPLLDQFVDTLQMTEGENVESKVGEERKNPDGEGKAVDSKEEEASRPTIEDAAKRLMKVVRESGENERKSGQERRGRLSPRKEREERAKLGKERDERLRIARSRPYANHPALQPTAGDSKPPAPLRQLSSYPFKLSPSSVPFAPTPSPFADVKVAELSHGLSRALFNPGVHFLRDPRSGVYNFPPETLENVPKISEFAFDKLPAYITSSKDETLKGVAKREGKQFVGSTSSCVGMLCQIYFWLSKGKEVNTSMLSEPWREMDRSFSMGQQLPVSVILNYEEGGERYSIDADKSFDATSESNILSNYGHLMEKLLTTDSTEFKRFLNDSEDPAPSEAEHRQAYHYATTDNMVLRSQLDAVHEYLPGNGTFDLKTRGTVAIRQDRLNYEESAGYKIDRLRGPWESFEREYYDLIRSAFLKYQFQARIGCMDGIFVAYHSTARFYGFQYLPISEMDEALFGTTETGQQVFRLAVGMLERLLQSAAECYPGESVNATFAADTRKDVLRLFVMPQKHLDAQKGEDDSAKDDSKKSSKTAPPMTLLEVRGTNYVDGEPTFETPVIRPSPRNVNEDLPVWQIGYEVSKSSTDPATTDGPPSSPIPPIEIRDLFNKTRETQKMFSSLMLPTGISTKDIKEAADRARAAGVELDPSDLSVRFPLDGEVTYRGPNQSAKALRLMSRQGTKRTEQEEEERKGERTIVVKSEYEVRE